MIDTHAETGRRFYRDRDRAVLGGVCAGLAEYLGFNLKVTRLLAFIAFLMAMPIAVIGYLAAVFLIPSVSRRSNDAVGERERESCWKKRRRKRAEREERTTSNDASGLADEINRRCKSMDQRLADLEKQVTSKRFQIDQELGRL